MSQHISDRDFQKYFEGRLNSAEITRLESHQDGCAACAENYDCYEQLFSIISESPQPDFSPAFTKSILREVAGSKAILSEKSRLIIYSILSFIGSIVVVLNFMDFSRFNPGFYHPLISFNWIDKMPAYFSSLRIDMGDFPLFFTGLAVILLIAIVDHLAIRKKRFRSFSLIVKMH